MKDKILEMFFDPVRWEYAIEKGVGKDIRKDQLIKLCKEETRLRMAERMKLGKYMISPPHTAKIPKENGEFRTVYINEPIDRVVLSIANDLLFDLMPEMIHPSCKSYQTGIGCGKVVKEVSRYMVEYAKQTPFVGWKADLSKYFDSVPLRHIAKAFDKVEAKHGHSALIDVLRKYYISNLYFDENNVLQSKYQSLKQGCAVASWLANVVLYDVDEALSKMDGFYVRYSDDILFVGKDAEIAMNTLKDKLASKGLSLNPKKVEWLSADAWFKFLGFSIKGEMISLSSSRIKTFQKEIEKRTIKNRKTNPDKAINSVNRYLYKGDGTHSWASQVLSVINVEKDIQELNKFVLDCLRAVCTDKCDLGGLGYVRTKQDGCVVRGKGKNVKANREKKSGKIEGFITLGCMRHALLTSREVYRTLVMFM